MQVFGSRRAPWRALQALIAVSVGLALPALGKDKARKVDAIWVHPHYDSLAVRSIALLPAASFDNSHENEKIVENLFGQALRPSGYRWVSPLVAKELIKPALSETALAAIDRDLLKLGRIDSLSAPKLCRALRTEAVMGVRIDLFERIQLEWNQAGKPSTTVQVRAALVDSAGRLLWSVSGSETADGTYRDPNSGILGVKGSGLNTQPVNTGESGAPSYEEVTTRLFARWMQHFPARKAPGAKP